MEEVIRFLKENRLGFLSSVDNGKPRVRPWGFMFEEKGKFYFCTNTTKEVYKQLKNTPHIEFSCCNREFNTWLRLKGQIIFSDDKKIKEKIFELNDGIKNMYKTPDNPIFSVFYMEHGNASISSFFSPTPKKFEF